MMGATESAGRPPSKADKRLPYTYEGWVDVLAGHGTEPVFDHYFSDTLCGLIEFLDKEGFGPRDVKLLGVFRQQLTPLDAGICTDDNGLWLKRPELCQALEEHFGHSGEECYRGHVEKGSCAFEDRERSGSGPVW